MSNTAPIIRIGIMPQEKIRERVLAIANGSYTPQNNEPKVWFTSIRSLAEVLSDQNRALINTIAEATPDSVSALAEMTGRAPSNLSRTLKTLANYGFVSLERSHKTVKPIANATKFEVIL